MRTKTKVKKLKAGEEEIDYSSKFNDMLLELSDLYKKFPKYLLEIKAEDYQIPRVELNSLIKSAIKSEKLTRNKWMDFSILGISTQDGTLIKKVITFSSLIYFVLSYLD